METSSPGITGTPDEIILDLADILSPIISIDSASGPIQIIPFSETSLAKSALSDRNP